MSDRRHAVVTGGGSGIGRAIVRTLVGAGWAVTIIGRDSGRLEGEARETPHVTPIVCDVGDEAAVWQVCAAAAARSGPVALLVNCAGIVRTAPFGKTTTALWDEHWRTNVLGAVHASQAVLPGMRALAAGRIVNIASTAALKGYAYASAYAATKHALLGLTRSLALELASTAITVNAVCPGYADTDIIAGSVATIIAQTGRSETDARAVFTKANPQGRLVQPDEVATAVLWLASEGTRSVTGQAIVVAGGEIM